MFYISHLETGSKPVLFKSKHFQSILIPRLYNPMKIKDLSLYDPDTPWLDYINRILSREIVQVSQKHRVKTNLKNIKFNLIIYSFSNHKTYSIFIND